MTLEIWGMIGAGSGALLVGLALAWSRFRAASGPDKLITLGPVFEATALAIFSAEHFFAARDLMPIVPRWMPGPLFWTYFVGAGLLAAAISFIALRCVRWSATMLALLFLIIVATLDLPNIPSHAHERLFWTLTVRELGFAAGAMVLAGSVWPREHFARSLTVLGRWILGPIMVFYGIQHVLFPLFAPGVPLELRTPGWMPAAALLAYCVGIILVLAGVGLLVGPMIRFAAAAAGGVLLLLTFFFYLPIFVLEIRSTLAVEGINYVGDTMLFAATVLLAGFAAIRRTA